ncbi:transporter substrate-binding domain-containing protein [Alteromonas sp. ASW11-19]|uniref:Transporter substrate-binding domain-containing protein n=1 Tax=Alteromonas salexigens TaxID=2982530 RepID=A0ABT2VQJ5_9ALTE|nr:transporter substrate-binding domain-containing protein [Alteromonas salexigens]MCU7555586.1 transporter substrate-binding domain-containing protein [Alteromonas salexigens]
MTELYSPFQEYNEEGKLTGCATELVRALAEKNNHELAIDVMPWSMAYAVARSTPNTMIFSIGRTPQREKSFHWVGEIAQQKLYFWVLANSAIQANESLDAFRDYSIAVVKDANTHQLLARQGFKNLYLMSATESNISESSRVQMLLKNRVDIMIGTTVQIGQALSEMGLSDAVLRRVHSSDALNTNLHLAFSKPSDPEIVKRYRQAFQSTVASHGIKECLATWQARQLASR